LAQWLEQHRAKITRVDLAHDDHEGKRINPAFAVEQYEQGGFNAGGRKPRHQLHGDWLDGEASARGRTFEAGSRASGKLLRLYEKGKQLGDPLSRWTRVEVEWHAQDRYIPCDVLTRPGQYLAGAYPCLAFLSEEQAVIRTIAKGARITFDAAVKNAKQQCGKLVNLMLHVTGGDCIEVVKRLFRTGLPQRIAPYSYHFERDLSMLDWDTRGALT
jgi:phage replication initiation protein